MLPARHAVLAPLLALFTALLVVPAACGSGGSGETASVPSAAPRSTAVYQDSADQVAEDEQGRSGWRWKGKRQDCFFRYQDHCYDSLQAACAAARCRQSQCAHDGSAPAVVTCRK